MLEAVACSAAARVQLRATNCAASTPLSARPREPARVQRLGHLVLQTTTYRRALNWYLEHLGMIVSDFQYYPGQRDRGPVMSFIRCDRGQTPADHHTLAMALGPSNHYVHSAYEVCDLDAIAAGGEYLKSPRLSPLLGHRPPHPGQPDLRLLARPGRLSGRALRRRRHVRLHAPTRLGRLHRLRAVSVGAPITKDFLGIAPGRESLRELRSTFSALRHDNEFDLASLRGLVKWPIPNHHNETTQGHVMTVSILRTADAWWVQTPRGAARIDHRRRHHRRAAGRPGSHRRRAHVAATPCPWTPHTIVPGDGALPRGRPDDQLRLTCQRHRKRPRQDPTDLLPQGLWLRSAVPSTTSSNPPTCGCWTTRSRSVW
jgi:hypothetical protein